MANGATTEVRDRIGAFLADRGWVNAPIPAIDGSGTVAWHSRPNWWLLVLLTGDGRVGVADQDVEYLDLPADAPDLLERLGETLDRLGV